ncbi:MAG TPA: SUMF1/EgtB/PvdO family nonheme iron enzyme [Sandaracinaceae bacterium LLY-WYZ-13_1]|nr:SUMF1/EgtB/PvdO family nonheme iron enzyme [Sandaracinaceae bacterium LLY-WYZ-13_1]
MADVSRRGWTAALLAGVLAACGGPAPPPARPAEAADAPDPQASDAPPAGPAVELDWVRVAPGLQMARTEVTVGQYRACVRAGRCSDSKVHLLDWPGHVEMQPRDECTYPQGRDELPMNCVSYGEAQAFCEAAGGRLPTADEWRAAASHGGHTDWPWGNQPARPTCEVAMLGLDGDWCGTGTAAPVCSRPAGNNRAGICDLVGSVYEWTARPSDPTGDWVMVGECFNNFAASRSLSAMELPIDSPRYRTPPLGVRCVRDR